MQNRFSQLQPYGRRAKLAVDGRTTLIEHFRDRATVMIATEAAAEGINLQFCSSVINYDLSWNPQRIEQRIGRCQSLLNVEQFRNPDEYNLWVERNGETQLVKVDLVETFNWLLGLTVKYIDVIRGVRVVDGANPDGDRVPVLWRNLDETDNDLVDQWFEKQGYSTRDLEYDLVCVNGDNNLENLRRPDQTWKVRLIEEEFHRLMFDVKDV